MSTRVVNPIDAEHEPLDTLTHAIVESSYFEITRNVKGRLTSAIYWTDSSKVQKLRELLVTHDAEERWSVATSKQYDDAGALSYTVTKTIARTVQLKRIKSIGLVRT